MQTAFFTAISNKALGSNAFASDLLNKVVVEPKISDLKGMLHTSSVRFRDAASSSTLVKIRGLYSSIKSVVQAVPITVKTSPFGK
jgi:hypothetical protein